MYNTMIVRGNNLVYVVIILVKAVLARKTPDNPFAFENSCSSTCYNKISLVFDFKSKLNPFKPETLIVINALHIHHIDYHRG